mmetsp:Transcript_25439/g.72656  ORF Transcript_25439/g.72656 Transcript_25439/m.72656 type:complete len:211 (-) Transcript_25439:308-940(-)
MGRRGRCNGRLCRRCWSVSLPARHTSVLPFWTSHPVRSTCLPSSIKDKIGHSLLGGGALLNGRAQAHLHAHVARFRHRKGLEKNIWLGALLLLGREVSRLRRAAVRTVGLSKLLRLPRLLRELPRQSHHNPDSCPRLSPMLRSLANCLFGLLCVFAADKPLELPNRVLPNGFLVRKLREDLGHQAVAIATDHDDATLVERRLGDRLVEGH